jgi:polar amino acid transport system substrate-binding protein
MTRRLPRGSSSLWRRVAGGRVGLRVVAAVAGVLAAVRADAQPLPLKWAGDSEGGAPYVEADPRDPARVTGLDVEIAELIAGELGRRAQFVQVAFTSLDQSAARGDFDLALDGIEDTPARRASLAVTVPYYEFREVLTVRAADAARFRSLADLRGRRVATLGGTTAYELLLTAEREHGVAAVSYDDDVHPYEDLLNGRVDAVLLDNVIAERSMRRMPGLATQPDAVAIGHYVGILGPAQTQLRDRIDGILRAAMTDGRLEAILRRWLVWNDDQPRLYARIVQAAVPAPPTAAAPRASGWAMARQYFPSLLAAAAMTLVLSCLSMALAVCLGAAIAIGRVYGSHLVRGLLTAYVEIVRGTPILLQLFVIYYGLASVVRLPAFVAALIGLGLNYAAYESEIYRGALLAVPRGQLDAARVLGLSAWQTLRLVRAPQALRFALAPTTNDFVAMLKDSSLVSVLTVMELTKQTQIFATNLGSWVLPGALCAALYLAMSLPLAHLARRLEARWKAPEAA